jgi:hypothetical protein
VKEFDPRSRRREETRDIGEEEIALRRKERERSCAHVTHIDWERLQGQVYNLSLSIR